MSSNDYKNALPREVDDHPDSGMPRQLRTQPDNEGDLSRAEADVAGITPTSRGVYGEDSAMPNASDQRDMNAGDDDADQPDSNARPRQRTYGFSENYGSPGGDEAPAEDDPGRGTPADASERRS